MTTRRVWKQRIVSVHCGCMVADRPQLCPQRRAESQSNPHFLFSEAGHSPSLSSHICSQSRLMCLSETGDSRETSWSSFWCRLALRKSPMSRATVLTGAAVCWLWSASAVRGWRRRTASLYKTYLWFITRVFHRHPCSVSVDRGRLWEYSCGGVWTRYAEGNGLEEKWRHRTNLQTVRN